MHAVSGERQIDRQTEREREREGGSKRKKETMKAG